MPVSIYNNCLIPDYDSLPEQSQCDAVSIRVKKTTTLILELYRPDPLGFEIRDSEDEDFSLEIPDYGYIAPHRPTPVNISSSLHLARISDPSQLVQYIRGFYNDIFTRNNPKMVDRVAMPCPLTADHKTMELKMRRAVRIGDSLYFGCFTKKGRFTSPGPMIEFQKPGDKFFRNCGNMLPLPWYIPKSLVTPGPNYTLNRDNISRFSKAAGEYLWLPQ